MAPANAEAVAAFVRVTGASESLARRKLEEHQGDLDQAISTYYNEAERNVGSGGGSNDATAGEGLIQLLSATRSFKPSLLLDPDYRRKVYNRIGSAVFKRDSREQPQQQQQYDQSIAYGFPVASSHSNGNFFFYDNPHVINELNEEEAMQLAIEASRTEYMSRACPIEDDEETEDLSRALALSLKTAKEEKLAFEERLEFEARRGNSRNEIDNALSAEEALFSLEPSEDDENAIHLVIRMPDGSRHERRFYRAQELKCLFNFIEAETAFDGKPYRVARQYPRRVCGMENITSSFEDLGFDSKHEVLFLEPI